MHIVDTVLYMPFSALQTISALNLFLWYCSSQRYRFPQRRRQTIYGKLLTHFWSYIHYSQFSPSIDISWCHKRKSDGVGGGDGVFRYWWASLLDGLCEWHDIEESRVLIFVDYGWKWGYLDECCEGYRQRFICAQRCFPYCRWVNVEIHFYVWQCCWYFWRLLDLSNITHPSSSPTLASRAPHCLLHQLQANTRMLLQPPSLQMQILGF